MPMVVACAGQVSVAPLKGRRDLLRIAGGLAASAVFAPQLARAQTFTATSISQAAQDARRDAGQLARRADTLLRLTVADGPERGGSAVRRFRAEQASLARDLATIFNSRVSEDDWLLVAPTRELDLVLTMQPLGIRLVPTSREVEAALKQPLTRIEPLANEDAEDVLLAMVLANLGLGRRGDALIARLKAEESLSAALKDAAGAVKVHRYGLAAFELERLMRIVTAPRIVATIAEQRGGSSMRTVYKALVVRFVPFIGWTVFVALLLATIYYNRDTTAPVLR
jgi:hypothetical protein